MKAKEGMMAFKNLAAQDGATLRFNTKVTKIVDKTVTTSEGLKFYAN